MPYKLYGLGKKKVDHLGLGVFDGLHLGHQVIASKCSGLLTFNPHPDIFLNKDNDLKMLTTLRELRYFVKKLVVLRFNEKVAKLSPIQFLDEIILKRIQPKTIIIGYDFHFGYKGAGNVQLLINWAIHHNIKVIEVGAQKAHNNKPVKSSYIRTKIIGGLFNEALENLGHSYPLFGLVIKGHGIGRQLGYPTANIKVPASKLIPNNGVYKGSVILNKDIYKCLIYIGNRPTFERQERAIEVHILNFDKDLYEKQLKVFIDFKIRDEKKFKTRDDLIKQIQRDITFCF